MVNFHAVPVRGCGRALLKGVVKFCQYCLNFLSDKKKCSKDDVNNSLLSDFKFLDRRRSGSPTLVMGVNEFLSVFPTFIVWFRSYSL
jgi:hypothetical protein